MNVLTMTTFGYNIITIQMSQNHVLNICFIVNTLCPLCRKASNVLTTILYMLLHPVIPQNTHECFKYPDRFKNDLFFTADHAICSLISETIVLLRASCLIDVNVTVRMS